MKIEIPKVSDERLQELAVKIKPLFRFKRKGLAYIKPCDLRREAFTWNPKFLEPAKGLESLLTITTYHTYGYYGFFKPSIAEVIAQIPAELLDTVSAFQITNHPTNAEDLNREKDALNQGFHVATTELFRRKRQ